jgi:hypothetical protein
MKKILVIITILFLASTAFISCQHNKDSHQHDDATMVGSDSTNMSYTCPMHPDVVNNEPGKCPKCGMDLVKKDDASSEMEHIHSDSASHEH